ncbi:MAG: argininosuccinate synthase [Candidatus Altiarchaeales archaeon ex4484_2]|nr:MAG: argininosuccinate synthase [Candidatus Altiarchaeales archaeon ex4484_2]
MKVVLAYSGGLDTSICIRWLMEEYRAEVVSLTLEVGQEESDLEQIEEKARELGAVETYSIDAREEFVNEFINPSIKANGFYEKVYPLSTALARPLISKYLVEIAEKEKADAVAHGSTGKGNDQVRFELAVRALNPELDIIAPAREWDLTRDEAVDYARKHDIPVPVKKKSPYSIDVNLWGRSVEAGPLEDLANEPGEEVYSWTTSPEKAPDKPEYIELEFNEGIPSALNGEERSGVGLIKELNRLGGKHGIGRIDTVEDRLVGIKSREVYECPAASIILKAHSDLEKLTLSREENLFKEIVDSRWSQMVYFGQWHEPLKSDLEAFINESQRVVSGKLRMKLYKGNVYVTGRESPNSLYDLGLATYDRGDRFDHRLAEGFVKLWGLPSEIAARKKMR